MSAERQVLASELGEAEVIKLMAALTDRRWIARVPSERLRKRLQASIRAAGRGDRVVRERYDRSRVNLIALMPRLTEPKVYDNSFEAAPHAGRPPQPTLVLHLAKGKIVEMVELPKTPQWAKALVAVAVKISK